MESKSVIKRENIHKGRPLMEGLELKSCPFCGSNADYRERRQSYSHNSFWDVRCLDDSCYLSDGAGWHWDTKHEALEIWNERQ